MGAHSAVRKNAKTWLVPAVGTAVAVTGQGLVVAANADASMTANSMSANSASTANVSGVAPGSNFSIAPKLQPRSAALAALATKLAKNKEARRLTAGDEDGLVLFVQKKLGVVKWNAKLGEKGAGYFGPKTRAAVMRFQQEKGIDAIGSVGPKTWAALNAVGPGKVHKFRAAAKPSTTVARASRSASRAPVATVPSGSSGSFSVSKVLSAAASLQGTPYVYGGTTTSGFDCSGFVGWVFRQAGVELPRTSRQIYSAVTPISSSSAKAGDLFFVRNSSGTIYHVGIVGANGEWWEARNSRYDVGDFTPWADGSAVLYGRV